VAVFEGLQRRRFDLAVCLHASFRTGLLGWMSGARWRSVRNHSGPDWFGNLKSGEVKRPKSIIQREFDGLRALGLRPADEVPVMTLTREASAQARDFWSGAGLKGKKVVALIPGAGKPEKRWPLERFQALASALKKKGRHTLWILSPGEPSPARGGLETSGSFESLQTLGAVLARAGAVVGNDSGPRHIAAACGARTLTLFGPEGLEEWHPYRREKGHWALKPASGRIDDLDLVTVQKEVFQWL
jgi:ADP-heptose:LPS heptosyltransferase